MGHIVAKVEGLRDILREYISPSLLDEAVHQVTEHLRKNIELKVRCTKIGVDEKFNMYPGDTLTVKYDIDLAFSFERSPVKLTEE